MSHLIQMRMPESPKKEQVDSFSASDSVSDSEDEEVDSALETTMNMIPSTRLGRVS